VKEDHFDLVLANLYGDLLLDLAEGLVARTRQGGTILLSGMLWEYNFVVRERFQRLGCELLENHMLEEFSTALFRR
jgi:ribosomal protein L11 methyltransferase